VPVLLDEVVQWLEPQPGAVIVDGTLGGGGHTRALAERVAPDGFVLAFDRDPAALAAAERNLKGLNVKLAEGNFTDLPQVLADLEIDAVNGIVLDLGLSSDQLADAARGFSFDADGPLDLRFDPTSGRPASEIVNRSSSDDLAGLLYRFGEERLSRRIAKKIVERRRIAPIATASQLADIVRSCYPRARHGERIDPATRTFQALRIAVNDELGSLDRALESFPECLRTNGRLAIISFHSLEDRRVKEAFRDDPHWRALTKKPLRASLAETDRNPRARSAKMRVAMRTEFH
jgi:16S rRNA (cytosine1402-N4)-methyltransferase